MSWWCPWYIRTGRYVRHKHLDKIAQVVWTTPRGDFEVELPGGGLVCWFRESVEDVEPLTLTPRA